MRMLQLGLPVDGYAVTGSTQSTDWGAICYEILGAIPDRIKGERIQYARAYILEIIGGYLMLDLSRNLVHLRWLLKLIDFRAAGKLSWGSAVLATLYREMCEATVPNKAKIKGCLSLLQSWARYRLPFLRPRVNHPHTFPLITRFRQPIPVAPEKLDDEHKTDLRQLNTDWPKYWSDYIKMWKNRYDYIPTRESIIVPKLACVPEYMSWFKIHGKPYLLSEKERRRQIRVKRERWGHLNPKRRNDHASPSIAAIQLLGPSTVPPQSPGPTVQPTTPTSQPF
ncbi:hypothetical protein J1N35_041402 [Gossypium stocksii]|uniref:Aminotransferase-like plant mobile domain-containing protein n=1 Tax=Gossypium stocksii TaxID=47602 RepID=A0A9D3ZJN9_9ROSI|nr:hypothetical protein J1N35_041402 [Gossypium stocksii]